MIRKATFNKKLIILIMLISLVIVIYTGFTYFLLATNKVKEMSMRVSEHNAGLAVSALTSYLNDINTLTAQILGNSSLRTFASTHPEDDSLEQYTSPISAFLKNETVKTINSGISIQSIYIFLKNDFSFTTSSDELPFDDYDSCLKYFQQKDILVTSDYTPIAWSLCDINITHRSQPSPVCIRFIYSSATLEKLGVAVFVLDSKELYESYSGFTEAGVIVSNRGTVLVSPNHTQLGSQYDNEALVRDITGHPTSGSLTYHNSSGKEVMLSYYSVMDQCGYLIVPFDFYSGIMQKEMSGYINATILIAILGLICSYLLSLGLSRVLTRSIYKLVAFIKRVGNNQFELRYSTKSNDEISLIGEKVNEMLDKLKKAADLREEDLIAQQQLELSLLQSQINPHLLYNTLDSVLWSIENDRAKDAATSIESLSEFFKLSLSSGNIMVPLSDEIRLIRHYIDIQRIARHKSISISFDIDPILERQPIFKLTLQPFVENAIRHGFAGYRDDGVITITTRREDLKFFITVHDNGIGILPEELSKITVTLATYPPNQDMHYFGLYNVNRRIVQTYGPEYGIRINSRVCEYTEVTVTMPYQELLPQKEDGINV